MEEILKREINLPLINLLALILFFCGKSSAKSYFIAYH
jgi:hypothetical protein